MKNAQISFEDDFLEKIDRMATENNKTRSAVVREAVHFWLKKKNIEDFEDAWIDALRKHPESGLDSEAWESVDEWNAE